MRHHVDSVVLLCGSRGIEAIFGDSVLMCRNGIVIIATTISSSILYTNIMLTQNEVEVSTSNSNVNMVTTRIVINSVMEDPTTIFVMECRASDLLFEFDSSSLTNLVTLTPSKIIALVNDARSTTKAPLTICVAYPKWRICATGAIAPNRTKNIAEIPMRIRLSFVLIQLRTVLFFCSKLTFT